MVGSRQKSAAGVAKDTGLTLGRVLQIRKRKPPSGPRTADFRAEVGGLDVGRVRLETDYALFDFAVLAI